MTIYSWASAQFATLIYGVIPYLLINHLGVDGKPIIDQPPIVQILFFMIACFLVFVCMRVFKICNSVKQPKNIVDSFKIAILSPFYKPKTVEE